MSETTAMSQADDYAYSSEWDLLNTTASLFHMANLNETGAVVMMRLRRKRAFYTVCLVLPMMLTSYMNTLVFLLPGQAGEKVSFLVSIYVSTSVFVSYFTSVMPRGLDSVPSTMKLLIGVIVESFLVLLATIAVLRRHHRRQHQGQPQNDETRHKNEENLPERERPVSVHRLRKPSRVHAWQETPPNDGQEEDDGVCQEEKETENVRIVLSAPTADQLDHVFFLMFFLGNSLFWAVLLYTML